MLLKATRKKLTIKDLTKKELIELLDCMPLFKAFLHEKRIAPIIIVSKYKQGISLFEASEKIEKYACRVKDVKKQKHARLRAYQKLQLAKKRFAEVEALRTRFPIEAEKEA